MAVAANDAGDSVASKKIKPSVVGFMNRIEKIFRTV
jgi:hypothetical protein